MVTVATDANKTTAQLVEAALPHMINSVMNVMQINGNWMNTENNRKIASEMVRTSLQYLVQLLEDRDALIELTLAECSIETHDEDGTEIPIPTRVRMMAMRALHPGPPVPPVADGPIKLYEMPRMVCGCPIDAHSDTVNVGIGPGTGATCGRGWPTKEPSQ